MGELAYRITVKGKVAAAIVSAPRCPRYDQEWGACDGLEGCMECLALAAEAVLAKLEER